MNLVGSHRKVSGREARRALGQFAEVTNEGVIPSLQAVIANEELTRNRVNALEAVQVLWRAQTSTFWGRLRWLVGR